MTTRRRVALAASGALVLMSLTLPAQAADPNAADRSSPEYSTAGMTYPVEDITYPVEQLHFPSGTASGGVVENGKKFTLSGKVLFEKDSAKLTSAADAELTDLVKRLKAQEPKSLSVDGYTDNVKGQVDNTKLSKDRAQVIGKRVKKALPGVKITVKGHGEKNPVADNKTERGKEANRRVEITAKG